MHKIFDHLSEFSYQRTILNLLHWDMETFMPEGAIEDRAHRLSYMRGIMHRHMTGSAYKKLLADFKKEAKGNDKKVLEELLWDFNIQKVLPESHVKELSSLQAKAGHVWSRAKKNNDLKSFLPYLQQLIDLKRKEAKLYKAKTPYDGLLRIYDKDFSTQEIEKLFSELKVGLIDLAQKVKKDNRFVKVKELKGPFSVEEQKKLNDKIGEIFGLPQKYSRLDISAHPFSTTISPWDQRITTRYDEKHLDSLGSTMHEVGHALYELNLSKKAEGSPYSEAASLSLHESQSRFWENIIGRSEAFMEFLHPLMKEHFPKQMKGFSKDDLFHYMNQSSPSLIRVESSELYYNFHIIIRFEIEKMIFNEGLNAKDIPKVWEKKYQEYLGVKPSNHAEGMLQDSHWAGGDFGYFPTYTLGNLISGSLYWQLKKSIKSFDSEIAKGNFKPILSFLVKNIHEKGRLINARDVVGKLEVDPYLKYLSQKFGV